MSRAVVLTLLVLLGTGVGVVLALTAPDAAEDAPIEWLSSPREVSAFRLNGADEQFSQETLQGQWSVLVFGFLHCPDICPTSLTEFSGLLTRLDGEIKPVFVSVDPARDAPSDIAAYVNQFHSSILGVTGPEKEISRLAGDLGIRFGIETGADDYGVYHSVTFSIIDPEGRLRGRLRPGFDPDAAASSLQSMILAAK